LLEEDELTSTEKLRLLRKFLLNPKLVDASPVIEGAKVKTLRNMLQRDLQQHDKIVVFVNNYIEDVIRGEKSFIADLQIPDGVDIYTIHGGMQDETNDRKFVEEQVNKREGKTLEGVLDARGITKEKMLEVLSEHYAIPSRILPQGKEIEQAALEFIPQESAEHYQFVPLGIVDGALEVGITDPDNIEALDALRPSARLQR
jgi:hypothetical protein